MTLTDDQAAYLDRQRLGRNGRGAVVVDDMTPGDPPTLRCLEIRDRAEAVDDPGDSAARVPGAIIRIHPHRVLSWGLGTPPAG